MKKIMIAGIIVLIGCLIGTSFIFFSEMTDPTPPQVRAGWYLPGQDIVWTTYGPDLIPSAQEQLILTGYRVASPPQFPELSPFSRYQNYTHIRTDDPYMIAVWYFNDERKFLESQKMLVGFLETSGTVSSVELNFTEHNMRDWKSTPGIQNSQNLQTIPDHIKATGYKSYDTSGYFFTVTIPGPGVPVHDRDYSVNKERYIVYYGTTTPANLMSETPFLKDMIAETYRYDHISSVGALI